MRPRDFRATLVIRGCLTPSFRFMVYHLRLAGRPSVYAICSADLRKSRIFVMVGWSDHRVQVSFRGFGRRLSGVSQCCGGSRLRGQEQGYIYIYIHNSEDHSSEGKKEEEGFTPRVLRRTRSRRRSCTRASTQFCVFDTPAGVSQHETRGV